MTTVNIPFDGGHFAVLEAVAFTTIKSMRKKGFKASGTQSRDN